MNMSMKKKMKTNLNRVLGVSIILSALFSCSRPESTSNMTGIPAGNQKALIKEVLPIDATLLTLPDEPYSRLQS